ncbi:MAG TPA: 30S ribosomal protein S16 [Streptosporangiaceae bacterium]|nr:30S ribosomal protein S16 [Streptosporangiaceae bacterium]
MAVKIKLKRMGKIRAPYYRIVVADSRTKRDGRAIEEIGKYHPKAEPSYIHVESERAQYWLGVGAQPTEPVRRILEITGDWQRFRGEPGAEGTLRTAAPKQTRNERFAEAVGARSGGGETTPKGGGKAKKADTDRASTDRAGTDKAGTDKASTDKASTDKASTNAADKGGDKGRGGGGKAKKADAKAEVADAKADAAEAKADAAETTADAAETTADAAETTAAVEEAKPAETAAESGSGD